MNLSLISWDYACELGASELTAFFTVVFLPASQTIRFRLLVHP